MSGATPAAGMRALVIGFGSIGRRHTGNLVALDSGEVAVCDPDPERARAAAEEFGVVTYRSIDQALTSRPDAALVCTPPSLHVSTAFECVEAGADVFIEKPLACELTGVEELLDAARRRGRTLLVGYNYRYSAPLQQMRRVIEEGAIGRVVAVRGQVGQYLPDWRPGRDYRLVYTSRADQGGGVLLDMTSHQIDYVRWLAGEIQSVYAVTGRLGDLAIEAEDTAILTLRLQSGALATLHADCLQRTYVHELRVIGTRGTLHLEFRGALRWWQEDGRCLVLAEGSDPNEAFVEEMRHFLACVARREPPRVPGEEGRRAVEILVAARDSARLGVEIKV
ncbi:MAG: Gfo/Idh/MocA family oxidoreductase [Candidatus Rokubacteria bacterium]|nr:Gfo/Idh/MocA family oxidoreductase [Candidatus Rokubacteria bacterium]